MGDMQVVANIDDKGLYGLMEEKPVKAVHASLQVSVSFGRFEKDSLSWEKFSAFSPNKYLEEVGKFATPGSVAQKKAYFEAHYKKVAERKAEIMDKPMDKNGSFRSVVTGQGSVERERSVTEYVVEEGCKEQFTCEEDKHVTDIATEVRIEKVNEETIIVKEEVKNSLDSQRLENLEEIALVEEKPEEVLHVEAEVREETQSNDTNGNTNEIPMKETTKKLTKKDGNRTRNSPKPDQVRTKPTFNKTVTSKKTPPTKEIKNMLNTTKKPTTPISKAATRVSSTPRVYKPASCSTSQSSVKKEHVSSLLRNKQTAPESLHMSMSLGPSASDPTALTSTKKSLIMERMGDKDIVKRAFKTFQKSYDFKSSVSEPKPALKKTTDQLLKHQNAAKRTSSPSVANGRPAKVSGGMEKRSSTNTRGLKSNVRAEKQQKELFKSGARPLEKTRLLKNPKAGAIDAKNSEGLSYPKAIPMQ